MWKTMLLLCSVNSPAPSDTPVAEARPHSDELPSGTWLGGMGSTDPERPRWTRVRATLDVEDGRIQGELVIGGRTEVVEGAFEDGGIELLSQRNGYDVFYSGTLRDGVLVGECVERDDRTPFQLVHTVPDDAAEDDCVGFYGGPDGQVVVTRRGHLRLADFGTGQMRSLFRTGEDAYVAGERYAIPHPVGLRVAFERDGAGEVRAMRITQDGGERVLARGAAFVRSELAFESFDGTRLVGDLVAPAGDGPHPAIVWVHGSGRADRASAGHWPLYFVGRGFAVLTVDKRGVGASGGTYEMPGGGSDNVPHMRRRARDVRAAVAALGERADVDAARIGLVGASQAGWVIPQAVERDTAFAIILSGGATQISYEGLHSRLAAEGASDADALSITECIARLRSHRATDYDFRKHFESIPCPALWLYGDMDRSNPTQLCVELIEDVARAHEKDFTIRRFPDGNHGLWSCRLGGAAEYPVLDRLVPGLDRAIADWLAAKGLAGGAG